MEGSALFSIFGHTRTGGLFVMLLLHRAPPNLLRTARAANLHQPVRPQPYATGECGSRKRFQVQPPWSRREPTDSGTAYSGRARKAACTEPVLLRSRHSWLVIRPSNSLPSWHAGAGASGRSQRPLRTPRGPCTPNTERHPPLHALLLLEFHLLRFARGRVGCGGVGAFCCPPPSSLSWHGDDRPTAAHSLSFPACYQNRLSIRYGVSNIDVQPSGFYIWHRLCHVEAPSERQHAALNRRAT
jgi:hypothetical protein